MLTRTLPLLLVLAVCGGCSSTPRRTNPRADSGTRPTIDSGTTPTDSGTVVLMDSGSRDTGGGGFDSGTADTGPGPWVRPATCDTDTVSAYSGPAPCSSSTASCAMACADGMCISGCLEADANPDCNLCALSNIIACFNANGCQGDWNCLSQCSVEQGCNADTAPMGCIADRCGAPDDAFGTCIDGVPASAMCGSAWSTCLP